MRPDVDLANIPLPSSPDPDNVRAYDMLIAEFMYVAVNTVPTITYAVPLKRGEMSSYVDSSWTDDKPSHKSTYPYFL